MAVYTKVALSGAPTGKNIVVTTYGTNTPVTVHTATGGTTAFDEIWIYACTNYGSTIPLTLYWGGTTSNDAMTVNIAGNGAGRTLVIDGRLLNNSLSVSAVTSQNGTNGLFIDGYANRIT